jgi:hypothetical protein
MRLLLTLGLSLFLFNIATAQVEVPLTENTFLIEQTAKSEAEINAHRLRVETAPPSFVTARGSKYKDTLYVTTGATTGVRLIKNIVDTLAFVGIKKGTGKIKGDSVLYTAPKGIKSIAFDTFGVVRCVNKTKCDTTLYIVVIKRAGKMSDAGTANINPSEKTELCGSGLLKLPGIWKSALIVPCSRSIAKYVNKKSAYLDTCIRYEASRFAGKDTVCLAVCDNYRVCDTLRFVINVAQKTLNVNESVYFMDDFSYAGPYPDNRLWLDDRVFVNNTMAPRPPSAGMATFDGVNEKGKPYGGGFGVSDVLTSTYLDLEGVGTNLFLSFYVTPKGYGFPPKDADRFEVDIRDKDGKWKTLMAMPGPGGQSSDPAYPFFFRSISIPNSIGYRYKGFQFRFKAYGSRNGMTSIWNLDYVKMSSIAPVIKAINNNKDTLAISADMALIDSPKSILKRYSSMPWWQFKGNEAQECGDSIRFSLINLSNKIDKFDIVSEQIKEEQSNKPILKDFAINQGVDYEPQKFYIVLDQSQTYKNKILTEIQGLNISGKVSFLKEIVSKSQNQDKSYKAVFRNDTLSSRTVLNDYYAYDDGSAESGWTAQGVGSQVAVKFKANVADKIQGAQMYIPRFETDQSKQGFLLKVWVNKGADDVTTLNQKPDYEVTLSPFYLDKVRDSLYGFSSYAFTDDKGNPTPINVPAGKEFYIGWEQLTNTNGPVTVGYDKNTKQGRENMFYKSANTAWVKAPIYFTGALMLRPVMGDKPVTNSSSLTATKDTDLDTILDVFPNPSSDVLYLLPRENIDKTELNMSMYNQLGQMVYNGAFETSLNVSSIQSGVYVLKIENETSKQVFYKKVMIQH